MNKNKGRNASRKKNNSEVILDAMYEFLAPVDQQIRSANIEMLLFKLRNVFASYFDLLKLDESHGILGGTYRDSPPETRDASGDDPWSGLDGLGLLSIYPHGGPDYFFPALTMSADTLAEFDKLPPARKFHIALRTKRIFVSGDKFHGYGRDGMRSPDERFWPLLLADPGDGPFARGFLDLEVKAGDLFAFEQISDLRGGDSRLIDNLESRFFNFPAKRGMAQFYWELKARSLKGCAANERLCYPGEVPFLKLQENLGMIMTSIRDVFVTSRDLLLLDRSHSALGGGLEAPSGEENRRDYWAEQEIREILQDVSPFLPVGSMRTGFAYFLPALTMPLAARVKFAALSDLKKFNVALKTKRVFVNGEAFKGYGGSGKKMPDAGFWSALFKFDQDHVCTDDEIASANTTDFSPGTLLPFWLERCIDRDGGEAHFIERLDLKALSADNSGSKAGSLRTQALESGMDRKCGMFELKRFGATPRQAAG